MNSQSLERIPPSFEDETDERSLVKKKQDSPAEKIRKSPAKKKGKIYPAKQQTFAAAQEQEANTLQSAKTRDMASTTLVHQKKNTRDETAEEEEAEKDVKYSAMHLTVLRTLCEERGLNDSGRKKGICPSASCDVWHTCSILSAYFSKWSRSHKHIMLFQFGFS